MTDLQKLLDEATPGPWILNKHQSIGAGRYGLNPIICEVEPFFGDELRCYGNHHANARLIAQAPDLAKRVLQLEAASRWQPIETCAGLESGRSALIHLEGGVIITALWVSDKWMSRGEELSPTHWMPLPSPPETEGVE